MRTIDKQESWDRFQQRQEFEHELINRKVSWFLTAQSVLFAAYGLALGAIASEEKQSNLNQSVHQFLLVVSFTGLALGVVTLIGVCAVIVSKYLSYKDYKRYCNRRDLLPPEPHDSTAVRWGVRTFNTWIALSPDVLIPALFISVWWALLTSPAWLV